MKIAFLGNFSVDYTSESHYLKTLRKLGHEVFPLQEGVDSSHQILARALKYPDMFLWVHTHGRHTQGMQEVIQSIKAAGIPMVGYHLDLWFGIEREKDLETDPYWDVDYFFTVDELMADFLNSRDDMPKGFFLPAGVFEDEAYLAEPDLRFQHDVVFTGSRMYHSEWPYREKLISWLQKTYGPRFAHYGTGGKAVVRGHALNTLYASSKVIIGDTLCKDFSYPYYLSDRVFEVAGRGGFIIHPYVQGLEHLFKSQKREGLTADDSEAEIITYSYDDFEYLKYLIDYYLQNDSEREAIRIRGHKRALADHTYTDRLTYILETIKNEQSN